MNTSAVLKEWNNTYMYLSATVKPHSPSPCGVNTNILLAT